MRSQNFQCRGAHSAEKKIRSALNESLDTNLRYNCCELHCCSLLLRARHASSAKNLPLPSSSGRPANDFSTVFQLQQHINNFHQQVQRKQTLNTHTANRYSVLAGLLPFSVGWLASMPGHVTPPQLQPPPATLPVGQRGPWAAAHQGGDASGAAAHCRPRLHCEIPASSIFFRTRGSPTRE